MKSNEIFLLGCILFFSILIASCSDKDQVDATSDNLIPLAVGNKWTYHQWTETSGEIDTLVIGISGDMTLETGERSPRVVYFWNWFDRETNAYVEHKWLRYNTEDGCHGAGGISPGDTLLLDALQFKYPVELGESWIYPHIRYDDVNENWIIPDTLEVFCTAVDTLISTPAGDLSCIELTMCILGTTPNDQFGQRFYYAPNIGYVGFKTYVMGEVTDSRLLSDYFVQ